MRKKILASFMPGYLASLGRMFKPWDSDIKLNQNLFSLIKLFFPLQQLDYFLNGFLNGFEHEYSQENFMRASIRKVPKDSSVL